MEFTIQKQFDISPSQLYSAWLDSAEHSGMTGGEAKCSAEIGEAFSAWDGYISGRNMELVESSRIVQSWRTLDFDRKDADSTIQIDFISSSDGNSCTLLLVHKGIPENQPDYKLGWEEHYFIPMREYFQSQ